MNAFVNAFGPWTLGMMYLAATIAIVALLIDGVRAAMLELPPRAYKTVEVGVVLVGGTSLLALLALLVLIVVFGLNE